MNLVFVFIVVTGLDMAGYVETRPYVMWGDSVRISGLSRAWIEGRAAQRMYGAHIGVMMVVPYDTTCVAGPVQEDVSVSRCALWIGPSTAQLVIGKQRVSLGVGRIFKPLDVFNPVNYFEPGYERSGVNAVLGSYELDRVTNIRAVYTPAFDWQQSRVGANVRTTVLHTDLGLTGIYCSEQSYTLAGAEIAGELIVGFWGEYAIVQDSSDDYTTFVFGMDYSFPLRLYAMVEYFFDGSGVSDPARYDFNDIIAGHRQTLAQHYIYGTLSTIPLPFDIIRPAMIALVNLNDEGVVFIPQVTVVPFDNIDIAVGSNIFFGTGGSEFRNIMPFDGAVYVWFRIYF